MSQARVPKLPSMREIGTYDGKIPAERYFRRLGHTLKHVNGGEQVDPSTYISMFELALDGDAAVFAETSFQVRSIMSQASKGVASYKDLDDLQRTFSVRYPPAYPPVSVDSFYAQVQTPIAEFVMDGVAVERGPIPQQPQAVPFVSHQQPLSRAYQEPYRPLQSNQQRYKYNTPANAEACRTPCVEPVLPPVAETTNQFVVETASLPQEQDFADEPIAHAAPADAAVGACLAVRARTNGHAWRK
ncbi:hypothetical protein E4U10_000617 [Claviceps purpurea]|nr:hypothetical protein E4U10_000617 [Claviceps purpurea]